MANILDFQSIYEEDENSIRARVEANADADIDLRAGEIFHDITSPIIFEIERLWDSINYYAALTFLPWSDGTYLDYKGLYEIGLARGTATTAKGIVTFIGELGTYVPSGTVVSSTPLLAADVVYQFNTLSDDQIGMYAPSTVATVAQDSAGSITCGVSSTLKPISYKITFVGRGGETDPSAATSDISVTAKKIRISGIPVGPSGTTSRKVYRKDGTANEYRLLTTIADNTTTVYLDNNGTALASALAPTLNSTDRVDIDCESLDSTLQANIGSYEINQLVDSVDGVESVANENTFVGGTDDEDDDAYRARLVLALSADAGQGNKSDYIRWSKTIDGVSDANVIPLWSGDNTVKVVLVGPENTAVGASIVAEVQALLDPNADGHGDGFAPIGAKVTVVSVAQVNLSVAAFIVHESQYSLDGTGGTSATRSNIVNAINGYLHSLPPGGDVIWAEMLSRIVTVEGVADVSGFTINSATSNVAIGENQVPVLQTHNFTA